MVIKNYLVINTTQWDAQVKNPKGSVTSLIHFLSFKWTSSRKFCFDFLMDMNLCLCGIFKSSYETMFCVQQLILDSAAEELPWSSGTESLILTSS
jgi:hypothetical protein